MNKMRTKKVTYEQVKDMLLEGEQWIPFLKDGIDHGQTHAVVYPPLGVDEKIEEAIRFLLSIGRAHGNYRNTLGAIVRVTFEGKTYRVMLTDETSREEEEDDVAGSPHKVWCKAWEELPCSCGGSLLPGRLGTTGRK